MKKILSLGAVLAVAAAFTGTALAADPTPVPFPAPTVVQVFVAAETVTPTGVLANYYAPGSTVVFRAYAVDQKTRKVLTASDVRYFYITIPNQPNVKLKYNPKAAGASVTRPWVGVWTVPATYAAGTVNFKILIQTTQKMKGQFIQMPVVTSQLTISATPPPTAAAGPATAAAALPASLDVSLYVDSVNGTRPAGAAPRPIGCTQTNVYKRGEQFVLRSWGSDLSSGAILSSDNVKDAHFSVPGVSDVALNWGAHGATTNRVWFWTNFWNIPTDFPLGDTTVKVVFNLESGKVGTYDYHITIIP
jgi:hypothetical protein